MKVKIHIKKSCLILIGIILAISNGMAQVMESRNFHIKDSLESAILNVEVDPLTKAELLVELTKYLMVNGEFIESNTRSRTILSLLVDSDKPTLRTRAYANLAEGYGRMGLLDSSFYFANEYVNYLSADNDMLLDMSEYGLIHHQLEAYSLVADFHFRNKEPNQAKEVINKAIDLLESIDISEALAQYPEFRYGHVYSFLGQLNFRYFSRVDGFYYFNRYIEEAELSDDPGLMNSALYWQAFVLFESKRNYKEALEYIKLIDIHQLDPMVDVRPWDVYWLTCLLYDKAGNADLQREFAIKSVLEVHKTDAYQEIIDVLSDISNVAMHLRDYAWALNNRRLSIFYKDFLISANNGINILQIESRLEDELQLTILNNKLTAQKNRSRLIIIGAVLVFAFNVLIFRNLRLVKRAKRYQNAANEKLQYEKEVATLKKEKLSNILEFKQRQLATSTLSSEHLNSQMNRMIETLEEVKKEQKDKEPIKKIDRLLKELKSADSVQDNWTQFYKHFENVHPNFFGKLLIVNDGLTQNDLRHCAYVQMSLSNKEVAHMYNVDPNSVKMARYRLKKKLHLDQEESLQDFIFQLTSSSDSRYLREA